MVPSRHFVLLWVWSYRTGGRFFGGIVTIRPLCGFFVIWPVAPIRYDYDDFVLLDTYRLLIFIKVATA